MKKFLSEIYQSTNLRDGNTSKSNSDLLETSPSWKAAAAIIAPLSVHNLGVGIITEIGNSSVWIVLL